MTTAGVAPSQRWADPLITVAVTVFAVVALALEFGEWDPAANPVAFGAVLVAGNALSARNRYPVAVLVVVAVARIVVAVEAGSGAALMPAAAVALYVVARHGDRRSRLPAAVAAAVIMMLIVAAVDDESFLLELLGEGAQMLLPIAVAETVRSRADRLRDLIDSEASSRVQAERLRIARDLHDIVAHGLSTITVQSGVASHLLDREPNQAREALDVINSVGKQSLDELRTMVGVLRSTDGAPLKPTPNDPNDLTALVVGAANAGVTVHLTTSGEFPPSISDGVVIAVHRIVQEALTNVARHAGATEARLDITHDGDAVTVTITNPRPEQPDNVVGPSTGVGIIGMRERAETLGGTLDAGHTEDGRFSVRATLPYPRTL